MTTGNETATGKGCQDVIATEVQETTATVLDFPAPAERQQGEPGRLPDGASAQIIIFPGVRVERWERDEHLMGPGQSAAAVLVDRDRLEFFD